MKSTQSPVDDKFAAKIVAEQSAEYVRRAYKSTYNIEVDRFIVEDTIRTYKCEGTGLEFYRGIEPGDGKFYEDLMRFDWYYNPWKWEHGIAKAQISEGENILEIGCGNGGFLKGIRDLNLEVEGIELNEDAVRNCQNQGLAVSGKSTTDLASEDKQYDWVVSFQVAEHIKDVGDFLQESVALLKPGGKLLVSVPNNKGFVGGIKDNILNLPPHHMNRWDAESLKAVAQHFGCHSAQIIFEPLQDEHVNWYVQSQLNLQKKQIQNILPGLRRWFFKKHKNLMFEWVRREQQNIHGHSVMGIFEKKKE